MRKAIFTLAFALLASRTQAQQTTSLMSIPGLANAVAQAARSARAVATLDLDKKLSVGPMVPIRTLKDSTGVRYLALGPGGSIKQGEHFKAGPVMVVDLSAVARRLEATWPWYQGHVDKVVLPDFWVGWSCTPPWDDTFTWKSWKSWNGPSISVAF